MQRGFIWVIALSVGIGSFSCGEKQDPLGGDGGDVGDVSYENGLKAILDANCISCHATGAQGADRSGAPNGVNFDTYSATVESADRADSQIQSGGMPPAGPLSDLEKAIFQAWIDQGMKE